MTQQNKHRDGLGAGGWSYPLETGPEDWARHFVTGLSRLRRRAGARLAPSGFNPLAQGEIA